MLIRPHWRGYYAPAIQMDNLVKTYVSFVIIATMHAGWDEKSATALHVLELLMLRVAFIIFVANVSATIEAA